MDGGEDRRKRGLAPVLALALFGSTTYIGYDRLIVVASAFFVLFVGVNEIRRGGEE